MSEITMKKGVLILILFAAVLPLFAVSMLIPGVEIHNGAEFFRPVAYDSELPFRTSYCLGADIVPLYFKSGSAYFGAGLSLETVSRSLEYGYPVTRAYRGIGALLKFDWRFSRNFMLGLKARLMFCAFRPVNAHAFASVEAELVPMFRLVHSDKFNLDLTVPVTAVMRKDGYALRAGVGVSMGSGR